MANITRKQFLLTGFLEYLIIKELDKVVRIITPSSVKDRGSQLSLEFDRNLQNVHKELEAKNVIVSTKKLLVLNTVDLRFNELFHHSTAPA